MKDTRLNFWKLNDWKATHSEDLLSRILKEPSVLYKTTKDNYPISWISVMSVAKSSYSTSLNDISGFIYFIHQGKIWKVDNNNADLLEKIHHPILGTVVKSKLDPKDLKENILSTYEWVFSEQPIVIVGKFKTWFICKWLSIQIRWKKFVDNFTDIA